MTPSRTRSLLLACCLIAASLGPADAARSAPVQWPVSEGGNGHYYEYVQPPPPIPPSIRWTEALDAAAARTFMGVPGHLATVTSDAERRFLSTQVVKGVPNPQVWIGGVQASGVAAPAAGWSWITGEPWAYTAWASGEPNDWFGPLTERYLSMDTYLSGAWNDNTEQGVPSAYVVEYAVPEPASAAVPFIAAAATLIRRRRHA
jgi:hypothetical protein